MAKTKTDPKRDKDDAEFPVSTGKAAPRWAPALFSFARFKSSG